MQIGIDEAGRGPVIGPLVVCCVSVPKQDIHLLSEKGVKDSKDLSSKRREEIKNWFIDNCQTRNWSYSLVTCPPKDIDYAVLGDGLNILETELFAKSLNTLEITNKSNVAIITDACDVDEQRFTRRISNLIVDWPWSQSTIVSYHKADENYPVVAMASIVAKQHRDSCIKKIEHELGFPIGSGYPSDPKTLVAVRKMIADKPHPQLRWSWATVNRLWKDIHNSEVPNRLIENGNQRTLF